MKIIYKYRIGQKVTLTNCAINFGMFNNSEKFLEPLLNKEVTIINRGFILYDPDHSTTFDKINKNLVDGMYVETFYYIAEDPHIIGGDIWWNKQYTRISERCFSGEEVNEEVEEIVKTNDDVTIIPGKTVIYENILKTYYDTGKTVTECKFTFSSHSLVIGVRKNYEIYEKELYEGDSKYSDFELYTFRQFLCEYGPDETHDQPRPRLDAARYGHKHWTSLKHESVWENIPDYYVNLYVDTAINGGMYGFDFDPFEDEMWKWEVEQWLRHLGVYDEVKKLYKEKVPKRIKNLTKNQKHKEELKNRIAEYIDELSDEEIEEMKRQLKLK